MTQRAPLRVFVTVKFTSDHHPEAWSAPENIVQLTLGALPPETGVQQADASSTQVVAITRADSKTRMGFDVFHDEYDPRKGHLKSEGNLPVWVVTIGKRNDEEVIKVLPAEAMVQKQVNQQVRRIHGFNNVDTRPPFREDYANGNAPITIIPRCPGGIPD